MADLGMRPSDLEIKIKEKEVTIDEKRFTQRRLDLERMRCEQRIHDYTKSIADIDLQIVEVDQKDLESLRAAHAEALAAEKKGVISHG